MGNKKLDFLFLRWRVFIKGDCMKKLVVSVVFIEKWIVVMEDDLLIDIEIVWFFEKV